MTVETMFAGFMAIVLGVGLLVWWSRGHRLSVSDLSPGEVVRYRVERDSRGAPPEAALAHGGALARHRAITLGLMAFLLAVVTGWAFPLVAAMVNDPGTAENYRSLADGMVGGVALLFCPFVAAGLLIQLFTEVDAVGIRRPPWAGGTLIPWSAVTEVSIAGTYKVTVLEVRAHRKRVLLPTYQFRNPAALIDLIRRHVPADRLNGI